MKISALRQTLEGQTLEGQTLEGQTLEGQTLERTNPRILFLGQTLEFFSKFIIRKKRNLLGVLYKSQNNNNCIFI